MRPSIRIEVTAEDIKNGKPDKCCLCPVALAVSRAFFRGFIYVSSRAVMVGSQTFVHSEVVSKFIKAFDAGEPVQPFSFELV